MAGTIRDVAREAGVSQATAARALAGYGYVSTATRRRVRQAALAIGYQPNAVARSLVSGATKTIGVVVGDIENPFFAGAARGIADVLERDGYTLLLANSDEDLARERRAVSALHAHQVDGFAVVPSSGDDGAHLAAIVREGRPVVLLDRPIAGLAADAVLVDNRAGALAAVRHLTALGHTRVGLVGDSPGIASTAERIDGYRAALVEAGVGLDDALVSLGGSSIEEGRRTALRLLEGADRPSALFTVNNFMTAGAIAALRELGLRMPVELALVGFDDLDWTTLVEPPITVVAQPVAELGRAVAERLLERLGGDDGPPRELRLETTLVVRGSCGDDPMSREAGELVTTLVGLDSTNPQLVPGGAGEGPVAAYLAQRLRAAGLELDVWDVLPGRPNVVATLRGTGGGKQLMLCGHTDVVRGSDEQFRPELRDGRVYGRGAVDMKGGIAAAVLAVERLSQHGRLAGDVSIALVIDEEWLSAGAEALVGRHVPDAAIFPEPSNLDVVIEHGGFAWFELESTGVEAAGGDTEHGRDSIAMLGPVLSDIRTLDRELATRPAPDWGRASIHASTITGGDQLPVYPASCTVGIERCLIPGETWRGAEDEIRAMLERARAGDPELLASFTTIVGRDPIAIGRDEPIARALLGAVESELGRPPVVRGDIGWMDSGILFESGVPCLTFGPIGAGEHTATEWVDVASIEACSRVLEAAARGFCE